MKKPLGPLALPEWTALVGKRRGHPTGSQTN
jgi:hypothetical protein